MPDTTNTEVNIALNKTGSGVDIPISSGVQIRPGRKSLSGVVRGQVRVSVSPLHICLFAMERIPQRADADESGIYHIKFAPPIPTKKQTWAGGHSVPVPRYILQNAFQRKHSTNGRDRPVVIGLFKTVDPERPFILMQTAGVVESGEDAWMTQPRPWSQLFFRGGHEIAQRIIQQFLERPFAWYTAELEKQYELIDRKDMNGKRISHFSLSEYHMLTKARDEQVRARAEALMYMQAHDVLQDTPLRKSKVVLHEVEEKYRPVSEVKAIMKSHTEKETKRKKQQGKLQATKPGCVTYIEARQNLYESYHVTPYELAKQHNFHFKNCFSDLNDISKEDLREAFRQVRQKLYLGETVEA